MRRRASPVAAYAAVVSTFGLALGLFVLGLNVETLAARVADGALAFVDLGAATALSFLIRPAR